jgi:hypothetical protein
MPDRPGRAGGVVEVGRGGGEAFQVLVLGDQVVQPRRDLEAPLRQFDGGFEQPRPGQAAVVAVRQLEHARKPRRTHRAPAHDRIPELHGRAVGLEEQLGRGGGGGGLAAVVAGHLAARALEVEQEGAAAQARGLGLDQVEHQLGGDGGIESRAAGAQDLQPGAGGERIGGGHHVTLGPRRRRLGRGSHHGEDRKDRKQGPLGAVNRWVPQDSLPLSSMVAGGLGHPDHARGV